MTKSAFHKELSIIALIPVIITACAINDTGKKQTIVPITLNAPATVAVIGDCNITEQLEEWLQVTVPTRQQFQGRLVEAASKNSADIRDDTLYLAGLRDTVAKTSTPDCGVAAQNLALTAMNGAIEALQGYYNRTLLTDINTALANPIQELQQIEAIQNELIDRMKQQYQVENNVVPTPP